MLRKYLLYAGATAGAMLALFAFTDKLRDWQPFALAGDVKKYRVETAEIGVEVWRRSEDDYIVKGGSIDHQLRNDPGNKFLLDQKQIIQRKLDDSRDKLDELRHRQIELGR